MAFSGNGRLLSIAATGGVYLIDCETGNRRCLVAMTNPITCLAMDEPGAQLSVGLEDGKWIDYSTADGAKLAECQLAAPARALSALAISPDQKHLATGGADSRIQLWELATGRLVREFPGHAGRILQLVFTPGGNELLSASWDKTARVWSVSDGQLLTSLYGHKGPLRKIIVSPNGSYAATLGEDLRILLWDIPSGRLIAEVNEAGEFGRAMCFVSESRFLAWGDETGRVFVHESATGKRLHAWPTDFVSVLGLAETPETQSLVSINEHGSLTLFSLRTKAEPATSRGLTSATNPPATHQP